jgi:septation ring formation regulator EzrA
MLFLPAPSLAVGEIYKWVDESGKKHFTYDIRKVPKNQINRAKQKHKNKSIYPPNFHQKLQRIENKIRADQKEVDRLQKLNIKAQEEHLRVLKDPDSTKKDILEAESQVGKTFRSLNYSLGKATKNMHKKLELETDRIMTGN